MGGGRWQDEQTGEKSDQLQLTSLSPLSHLSSSKSRSRASSLSKNGDVITSASKYLNIDLLVLHLPD